jgi:hypothetical protein
MQRYAAARLAAGYSNLIHTGGVPEDSNLPKIPYCRNFDLKRVWSLHLCQIGFPSIVTITDSPVLMLIAMGHSMERSVGS